VNPDLTMYVLRPPEGEWVGIDSSTAIDSDGVGVSESRLFDERGAIGRAVQALYVEAR
jgi:acyl-CoA thioesterase